MEPHGQSPFRRPQSGMITGLRPALFLGSNNLPNQLTLARFGLTLLFATSLSSAVAFWRHGRAGLFRPRWDARITWTGKLRVAKISSPTSGN